jgi:hypothetical protein
VTASAREPLGSIAAVRALPGGRVLVNDMARRRVLLFDSTLAAYTVVADTTSATGNAYGGRLGGLLAFRGDSSLFVDPQSLSMLVIDPQGKLGRVMSVPRASDATSLTGLALGAPGFDAQGRLVYRAQPGFNFRMTGEGPPQMPAVPDSAPIVRVDLATRRVDTVTFVRTPRPNVTVTQDAEGRPSVSVTTNPLPTVDDWAVLSDGTIAVLRGRDFHVDLVGPDGAVRAAPRMPYDWQRMSDEYKVAFLDSTRTAMERQRAQMQAALAAGGGTATSASGDMVISMRRVGDGPPPRGGAGGGPGGAMQLPPVNLVSASELPDYKPAFGQGAARADADGNLWVRLIPTRALAGRCTRSSTARGRWSTACCCRRTRPSRDSPPAAWSTSASATAPRPRRRPRAARAAYACSAPASASPARYASSASSSASGSERSLSARPVRVPRAELSAPVSSFAEGASGPRRDVMSELPLRGARPPWDPALVLPLLPLIGRPRCWGGADGWGPRRRTPRAGRAGTAQRASDASSGRRYPSTSSAPSGRKSSDGSRTKPIRAYRRRAARMLAEVCSVSAVAPASRARRAHAATSASPAPSPRAAGDTASSRSSGHRGGAASPAYASDAGGKRKTLPSSASSPGASSRAATRHVAASKPASRAPRTAPASAAHAAGVMTPAYSAYAAWVSARTASRSSARAARTRTGGRRGGGGGVGIGGSRREGRTGPVG